MTEEEMLFAAIRANPDEDTPRLAYADWLDEHVGQRTPTPVRPERSTKIPIGTASERAEYIRIECERARLEQGEPSSEVKARLKELRQRSSQLRNSVVKAWEAPFRHGKPFGGRIDGFRFDRGLPKWVILEANEALDYGEALLRQTPVSEFHLNELSGEQLGHLLGAAFLRHLPQLCIDGHHQQLVDLGQFAGSTNTTYLTSLKLYRGWSLTPSGADRLAQSETLPNLRRLLLSGEQFDATGFARLFDGPTFRQLIELHLWNLPFAEGELGQIFGFNSLATVEQLALRCGRLGHAEGMALARSGMWSNLRSLHVMLGPDGSGLLSPRPGWLRGWAAAIESSPSSRLERLNLAYCSLGDPEAASLARWPIWHSLLDLQLSLNPEITREGWREIIRAMAAGRIYRLHLYGCTADNQLAKWIADAPHMTELQELTLGETQIADPGAIALADSPYLGQLRTLSLHGCRIGPAARRKLKKRFAAAVQF